MKSIFGKRKLVILFWLVLCLCLIVCVGWLSYARWGMWPFLCLFLIFYFVFLPICKNGLWQYLAMQQQVNPLTKRLANWINRWRVRKMSRDWYRRTTIIDEKDFPQVNWQEDTDSSRGIDSFYCLDQQADDVRSLLSKDWDLQHDKLAWPLAQYTGEYFFKPEIAPLPIYKMERMANSVHIETGTKPDTWVYLVGKQPQPTTYALEFDFISYTQPQETLQMCFATNSLASRLRFNLENNETLKFDVVDHGYFLYWENMKLWDNLKIPFSISLKEKHHVQLQCIENVFGLFIDRKLVMAVRIEGFEAKPNPWYFIFWNGWAQQETGQSMQIDIKIENFKILHKRTQK